MTTITMPTKKKRINITVSDDTEEILKLLAKADNVPVAAKAKEMLEMGLDLVEDLGLSVMANERLANDTGKYYSHEDAWS
jgi:predicted DNA-binding protein